MTTLPARARRARDGLERRQSPAVRTRNDSLADAAVSRRAAAAPSNRSKRGAVHHSTIPKKTAIRISNRLIALSEHCPAPDSAIPIPGPYPANGRPARGGNRWTVCCPPPATKSGRLRQLSGVNYRTGTMSCDCLCTATKILKRNRCLPRSAGRLSGSGDKGPDR